MIADYPIGVKKLLDDTFQISGASIMKMPIRILIPKIGNQIY